MKANKSEQKLKLIGLILLVLLLIFMIPISGSDTNSTSNNSNSLNTTNKHVIFYFVLTDQGMLLLKGDLFDILQKISQSDILENNVRLINDGNLPLKNKLQSQLGYSQTKLDSYIVATVEPMPQLSQLSQDEIYFTSTFKQSSSNGVTDLYAQIGDEKIVPDSVSDYANNVYNVYMRFANKNRTTTIDAIGPAVASTAGNQASQRITGSGKVIYENVLVPIIKADLAELDTDTVNILLSYKLNQKTLGYSKILDYNILQSLNDYSSDLALPVLDNKNQPTIHDQSSQSTIVVQTDESQNNPNTITNSSSLNSSVQISNTTSNADNQKNSQNKTDAQPSNEPTNLYLEMNESYVSYTNSSEKWYSVSKLQFDKIKENEYIWTQIITFENPTNTVLDFMLNPWAMNDISERFLDTVTNYSIYFDNATIVENSIADVKVEPNSQKVISISYETPAIDYKTECRVLTISEKYFLSDALVLTGSENIGEKLGEICSISSDYIPPTYLKSNAIIPINEILADYANEFNDFTKDELNGSQVLEIYDGNIIAPISEAGINLWLSRNNVTINGLKNIQGSAEIGQPVPWLLSYQKDGISYSTNYLTAPIYKEISQKNENYEWTKVLKLESSFKGIYSNVSLTENLSDSYNISIDHDLKYSINDLGVITVLIDSFSGNMVLTIKGISKNNPYATDNNIVNINNTTQNNTEQNNTFENTTTTNTSATNVTIVNANSTNTTSNTNNINTTKVIIIDQLGNNQQNQNLSNNNDNNRNNTNIPASNSSTNTSNALNPSLVNSSISPSDLADDSGVYVLIGGNLSEINDSIGKINTIINTTINLTTNLTNNITTNLSTIDLTNLTSSNITEEPENQSVEIQHKEGNFNISTDTGEIESVSLDADLNMHFVVGNITPGQIANISIKLPELIPDGMEIYLWKENGTVLVPYILDDTRQIITLQLQDGVVDEDGIADGKIVDPLKLYLPAFQPKIDRLGSKRIKAGINGKQIDMIANADFSEMAVVDPSNIPSIPENPDRFEHKILKFALENLTDGKAEIILSATDIPSHPRIWKFNSNTLEWYEFPFEVQNDGSLKITIIDGKLGDDDGLVDGIIHDDLGITNKWYNDSWPYRTAFNVSNYGGNFTNFQVNITLNTSNFNFSITNSTLSDIRFTFYNSSSDTETLISHWMETSSSLNYTSGNYSAILWFKVPYLRNNTNSTFFIYYGNQTISSASNASAVFDFYDDFSTNLNKWNVSDVDIAINNSYLNISGGSTGGAPYGWAVLGSNKTYTGFMNGTIEGSIYLGTNAIAEISFRGNESNNSGYKARIDARTGEGLSFQTPPYNGWNFVTGCTQSGTAPSSNTWYNFSLTVNGSTYTLVTGGQTKVCVDTAYNMTGEISLQNHYGDYAAYDNIKVRKYTLRTPTISILSYPTNTEYQGDLNISINLPAQSSVKLRSTFFTMNGTVNCSRSSCGNVYVNFQYFADATPSQTLTETNTSDFASNTSTSNVSVSDTITLYANNTGLAWWNTSWPYRTPYNISNRVRNETNYQVRLNLTNSTVGSSFNWSNQNVTRFVWYNSSSSSYMLCPYFVQTWNTSGQNATIWVKVPFLQNGTNTTLYMYYGSLNDTSNSSGGATFDFYSDGSSISDWTVVGAGVNSTDGQPSPSLEALGGEYAYINASVNVNRTIEFSGYVISGTTDLSNFYFMTDSAGLGQMFRLEARVGNFAGFATTTSWASWNAPATYPVVTAATWHSIIININTTSANATVDGTDYGTLAITNNGGYIAIHGDSGVVTGGLFDNIIVRKFMTVGPNVTNGTEQRLMFNTPGNYVSSAIDLGSIDVTFNNISWTNSTPQNTTLVIYTRSSADNSSWSGWFTESNGIAISSPSNRYIQYKVNMSTTVNTTSPALYDLTIGYQADTNEWRNMESTGTLFTASSPYNCGAMTNGTFCYPTLSVVPTSLGNYSLRFVANNSDASISENSSSRNISVYLQPDFTAFSSSASVVARTQSVTITAQLVDEAADGMVGYNIIFYDETGNGTRLPIANATTDSTGVGSVTYTPTINYTIGSHTINVSIPQNDSNYMYGKNETLTIIVSSLPNISNISVSPTSTGFGLTINLSANITDQVGVANVTINITNSTGSVSTYNMTKSGTTYYYIFNDSWRTDSYTYTISVNNTDGIRVTSAIGTFSIISYGYISFVTNKTNYKNNEIVTLKSPLASSPYSGWKYRNNITINTTSNIYNYSYMITLNSTYFNFSLANSNGSDMRATYYNFTSGSETAIPYWIETWNVSSDIARVWVQVPYLNSSSINYVYLYYGNSSAQSAANGSNVFVFFDDFDGSSLDASKWNSTSPTSINVTNGSLRITAGTVYTRNTVGNTSYLVVESKVQWNVSTGTGYAGMMVVRSRDMYAANTPGRADILYMTDTGGSTNVNYWGADDSGTGYDWSGSAFTMSNKIDYILGIQFNGTATKLFKDYSQMASFGTFTNASYLYLGYFTGNQSAATDIQDMNVSWIRARNYTQYEPTLSIARNEYVLGGVINNGTTNFTGYVKMIAQSWTGSAWQNIVPPIVDQYFVNVTFLNATDIMQIWSAAGGWNTTTYSPGWYRIYARLENPSHQVLVDSLGNNIELGYNFSIVEPLLIMTNLTHENLYTLGYSEYETNDTIDWINVTFTTFNNTAYNAVINLSVYDQTLTALTWGPQNENKSCGNLSESATCQNRWNNSGSGYNIPTNASTGEYTFLWNVNMDSDNGPVQTNYSSNFTIHNIPATINSTLGTSRLYRPNSTKFNVSFINKWSRNITNVSIRINCPQITGFNCTMYNSSWINLTIGNVTNGTLYNTSFNITVNTSVNVSDYLINVTLSYTNPRGDYKNWSEIGGLTLEVRYLGILAITDYLHPSTATRGSSYSLQAFINNTGTTTANLTWLNYTLPTDWTNTTGNYTQNYTNISVNGTKWNNLTVSVGLNSTLGANSIRLDSGASDGRNDFKIYTSNVYAYSILNLSTNVSLPNIGDNVLVYAVLAYDNGTLLSGKNISFYDNNTGFLIGTALTDSSGYASVTYALNSTLSLGSHTLNASYNGTATSYILSSYNTTSITIHRIPQYTSITVSPSVSGFGQRINFTTVATDDDNLDTAIVQITYPNNSRINTTMSYTPPSTFRASFNNTWINGVYNISIFINDSTGALNNSNLSSFTIASNLTLAVAAINTTYSTNQYVNLTDGATRWWNTSWPYRQDINITNISKNLTDYQYMYRINTSSLYTSSKINSDCSDIRFAYYNTFTYTYSVLPFVNDTPCNITGFNTTFWVKVPLTIPSMVIEVYYGNTAATSNASAKENIFDFIDDFEGSSLNSSKWTATSSTNVSVGSGKVRINAGSIYTVSSVGISDSEIYESFVQWATGTGSEYAGMMIVDSQNMQGGNAGSNANALYMTDTAGSANVNYYGGDGTAASYNLGSGLVFARTSLTEYILGVAFNGTRTIFMRDNVTQIALGTFNKTVYLYLGHFQGSGAGTTDIQDINISWIRARKYHNSTINYNTSGEKNLGSAIYNSGQTNNSGYLTLKVQKNVSSVWTDVQTIVNDTSSGLLRNINLTGLNLSSIWNNISWSTGINTAGSYRVYAVLSDPYDNILNNTNNELLTASWPITLSGATIQVNITAIRVYSVGETSEANWHIYTSNLIDSGLNKTFLLNKNGIYRIEIDVNNTGAASWDLNSSNVTYTGLNSSWPLNYTTHIWYSNLTTPDTRRSDSANTGGVFNGTIKWNTTKYNGTVFTNNNVTFYFIVNASASEQRTLQFNANHLTFSQSDYSTLNILDLDITPPTLYNSTYAVNTSTILRGGVILAYARWAETILSANVTYTTTSNSTYITDVNSSASNTYNWTNFTITSSSLWFLGNHTVQIKSKDQSGNENKTLSDINVTVQGVAQIVTGQLNSSSILTGQISQIQCKVNDSTNTSIITSYLVSFYNSTGLLGTAVTNGTGWANYNYTDNTAGSETLSCNITANSTIFYTIDGNNNLSFSLTTTEGVAPTWSSQSGPNISNKGMPINLSIYWQDNFALANASLATNATGTMANVSNMTLSGTAQWANFTYTIPTTMNPGTLVWLQYGRDTSGNVNVTANLTILIYGWSNITNASVSPSSIQSTNYTNFTCRVIDGNTSVGIANYSVNFSYKLTSSSTYTLLGSNITNSSGYAFYRFNLSTTGIYDVMCNITTNSTLQYNVTSSYSSLSSLTVVAGADIRPPVILVNNYTLNVSQLNRSECVKISGLWNESINSSTLTYDYAPGSSLTINVTGPFTGNWTNYTLCTNNSWSPGNLSMKLQARDQSGNLNNTLSYLYFVMKARSQVAVISPTGSVNRGFNSILCNVSDYDTGAAISNYSISFYDTDLGFSLGTNTTNSSGGASESYNYASNDVGPDDISCNITSTTYYIAQSPLTTTSTINWIGTLVPTLQQPSNNSIIYKNQTLTLNITTLDENNNLPKDYLSNVFNLTVNWTNSSGVTLALGNFTTWKIPNAYPLGTNIIYVNVNGSFYNNATVLINTTVYGFSNLSIVAPVSGNTYGSSVQITFNCSVYDNFTLTPIQSYLVLFYANNSLLGTNITDASGNAIYSLSTSLLTEGTNQLTCTILTNSTLYYNISNNWNRSVNVTVDTIGPNISYNPNSDANGTYGRNWSLVNVSVIDNNIHTVLLNWNGTNESFQTTSGTHYWSNKTNLADGNYTIYAWVNDTGGSSNQTVLRNIQIDTVSPNLSLNNPINRSYNLTNITLNYTVFDLNILSCWYNNGTANITLASCSNTTFVSLAEGVYVYTLYANDTVGHQSSVGMNFTVDRTLPRVNITLPVNYTSFNSTNSISFNFTATDNRNISTCFYSLDNASNVTLANCANTTLSGLSNTNHSLVLFANDTAGNLNQSMIWFLVNLSNLVITVNLPINNSYVTSSTYRVNISTNRVATNCNYTLDAGTNTTMLNSTTMEWYYDLTSLTQTNHSLRFDCTNGQNHTFTGLYNFTVDLQTPVVTFVNPTLANNSGTQNSWVYINVTTNESCLNGTLQLVNSSTTTNYTMTRNTSTNFHVNITGLLEGTYNYTVFVNDSAGNVGYSMQSVILSFTNPVITIVKPTNSTYNTSVVNLNATASASISSWWFILNNEQFNFTPPMNITMQFGINNLTVYGKDSNGLTGNSSVYFSMNGTNWTDDFHSFTGMDNSSNINITNNATSVNCWSLWKNSTFLPQDEVLSCWYSRRQINVTYASQRLINYQARLSINLSLFIGNRSMQSDCDDIRFSYYNNSNSSEIALSHWIESCNSGNNATVWVKIPEINSSSILYMYYNNPYASDASNGTAVFDFFDDFSSMQTINWGANAANWVSNGTAGYANVAGATSQLTANYSTGNTFTTEMKMYGNSTSGVAGYMRVGDAAATKNMYLYMDPLSTRVDIYNGSDDYFTIDSSVMQRYTFKTNFSGNNYSLWTNFSTEAMNLTAAGSGSVVSPILYSYYIRGMYVDWIAIRKYSYIEPNVSMFATAENSTVNSSIKSILISPSPIGYFNKLYVNTTTPSGTNITFEVYNSSNSSLCGVIQLASITSSGYSLCNAARSVSSIYLVANLTRSVYNVSPTLNSWTIDWTTTQTLAFSGFQPSNGTQYNLSSIVSINVSLQNSSPISNIYANVSNSEIGNFTIELTAFNTSLYRVNLTNLSAIGVYNIVYWGNLSTGFTNNSVVQNFYVDMTTFKTLDIIDAQGQPINNSQGTVTAPSGLKNVTANFTNSTLIQVVVYDYNASASFVNELLIQNVTNDTSSFNGTFAIDPSRLNFSYINITFNATGTTLFKCLNYSFSQGVCADKENYSEVATNLIPGQTYTITIYGTDPSFGININGTNTNVTDAYIRSAASGSNFGGATFIRVGRSTAANMLRGVVWFNLSYVPSGAQVDNAYIELFFEAIPGSDNTGNRTHGMHRINYTRPWQELQVSWDNFNTSDTWTTAGGDYNTTEIVNVTFNSTNLTTYIRFNVTADVQAMINNQSSNFGWLIKDEDESSNAWRVDFSSSESTNSSRLPRIVVNYTANSDLMINNVAFSALNGSAVEGQVINITVNVTNNGSLSSGNFTVQLNTSQWNGTTWIFNETMNSTYINLTGGESRNITFNWTVKPGTFNISVFVDYTYNVSETDETNNKYFVNYTTSAWQILYGLYNYSFTIYDNGNNKNFSTWQIIIPDGNSYYSDSDSSFTPSNLMPLNGTNDLLELDRALNMTGFNDSVKNLYDRDGNGFSDRNSTFNISGTLKINVPVLNSTNSSAFITGILWDSADGGSQYDGTQDVIFVTKINTSKVGQYGNYDYEVRLPSKLEKLKGSVELVTRLDELI